MLVTERVGRMRIVARDGTLSKPLRGLPPVFAYGEGGLMDVVLDPHLRGTATCTGATANPRLGVKPVAALRSRADV